MLFKKLFNMFLNNVRRMSIKAIFAGTGFHFLTSYFIFLLIGETKLVNTFIDYLYLYIVTSSTVGFGDLTPETQMGRLFTAVYFIPISLVLFTIVITKVSEVVVLNFRKYIMGLKDFSQLEHHIAIIGYHQQRTKKIVELILADENRDQRTVLLVTKQDIHHPFVDIEGVEFCKVESFTDDESLRRIAIDSADRVIIDGHDDNENFTNSIHFKNKVSDDCHITTYLTNEDKADTLREVNGNIEVCSPKVAEQMVRAMQDHGTSMAFHQLMTTGVGQTTYVSKLHGEGELLVEDLNNNLQKRFGAKFMGYSTKQLAFDLIINPPEKDVIKSGMFIHYVAESRLSSLQMSQVV